MGQALAHISAAQHGDALSRCIASYCSALHHSAAASRG
jgi:hypothetical protein